MVDAGAFGNHLPGPGFESEQKRATRAGARRGMWRYAHIISMESRRRVSAERSEDPVGSMAVERLTWSKSSPSSFFIPVLDPRLPRSGSYWRA